MSDDIAVKVENVSKSFILPHERVDSIKSMFTSVYKKRSKTSETQRALQDISFEIRKGEFFGIVGRNGSGKSTMLKILAGIYQPSEGSVQTSGKLVPFIELGVGFNPELTGRENVFLNGAMLGFSRKEIAAMYDEIVEFAELEKFMDQKLKNYSSGMQVRLAFSMATRAKADILLVDEVLAVGDADFQRKCFRFFKQLKKDKKTVVFVTHDMNAVREYCDRGVFIEDSKLVAVGTPREISKLYEQLLLPDTGSGQHIIPGSKRWGDGTLKLKEVRLSTTDSQEIVVNVTFIAKRNCDDPSIGFALRSGDGTSLIGTNTALQGHRIAPMKSGDVRSVTWSFANVLADGDYTVTAAAQYDNTSTTGEWWEDAASVRVTKPIHSPYIVDPDIKVTIKAE